MIRYLSLVEVIDLQRRAIEASGGSHGIRDIGALQSSVAQPYATFSGQDLYPTIIDKAAALGYSLIMNHPFVDGNKRVGHAAMAVFLRLNGSQIAADVDEQEQLILGVAAGTIGREAFNNWVNDHTFPLR